LLTTLVGLGDADRDLDPDSHPTDPAALSYRLAADLPLAPADRQALLADDSAADRLAHLVVLLRREIVLLRRTRTIAVTPSRVRLAPGRN
jgi:Lon protease-like protein